MCEVEDQHTGPLIEAMSARKARLFRFRVWGISLHGHTQGPVQLSRPNWMLASIRSRG